MEPVLNRATASVDLANILLKYATDRKMNQVELLAEAAIDPSLLENCDARISIRRFIALWKAIVNHSGDPDFGLHFGEQAHRLMERHLLVSLMTSCSTVIQAVRKNFLYHNLLLDGMQPVIIEKDKVVSLSWKTAISDQKTERHYSEAMLSLFVTMLRYLTENRIGFKEVRFSHTKPPRIHEHQRIFKAPLKFNQDRNEVIVERNYLDQPIFLANNELLETLETLAQRKLHRIYIPESWSEQVIRSIWKVLIQEQKVDIDTIAKEMAMSSRNLQKKLKEEGTTFRQVLGKVRQEIAMDYLKDIRVSICEIALLLGFSDQSSFNRAFKRWTGVSPLEYRNKRR